MFQIQFAGNALSTLKSTQYTAPMFAFGLAVITGLIIADAGSDNLLHQDMSDGYPI